MVELCGKRVLEPAAAAVGSFATIGHFPAFWLRVPWQLRPADWNGQQIEMPLLQLSIACPQTWEFKVELPSLDFDLSI
jgi:hypothetical protein